MRHNPPRLQHSRNMNYNSRENLNYNPLYLFDLVALFTVLTGLAGLFLLSINSFDSLYTLIIGTILTAIFFKAFRCQLKIKDQRLDFYLLIITLICLFFIAKPFLYIMGGQDQGLYVNMSATYEETGSTFIKDHLRKSLPDEIKQIYDKYNQYNLVVKVPDRYEGSNMPGVFIENIETSEYVYQFYPLHPTWMAIFAKLFGQDNRVYSLTFFALLSIITFFLLAYELSNRRKLPGYIMAAFLALNPLFTFFAKFPVSEMLSVAFSALGFYYLLIYYKGLQENRSNKVFLFLSSLSFLNLFFNHISGFLYVPIFYLLILITVLYLNDSAKRKTLLIYLISVLFGYSLSVLYGLKYSFPYSFDIYNIELSRLVLFDYKIQIILIILLAIATPFVVNRYKTQIKALINRFLPHILNILVLSIILLIPLNIYDAYNAGIIFGDLQRVMYSSAIYITTLYLTPLGLILFIMGLVKLRKIKTMPNFILILFLLLAWYMKIIISVWIGYQYYAARYLFNEVIIYSLLFIALYCGHLLKTTKTKKYLAAFSIITISLYFGYFTSLQLQGQEADGSNQALSRISKQMDEQDILIPTFSNHEINTPLKYYFGLNTFTLSPEELSDKDLFDYFLENFNDIFVLSNKALSNRNLEIIDIIAYKEGIFEHPTNRIPTKFFYHNTANLYLYKISRHDYFMRFITIKPTDYKRIGFYDDNVWTNGEGIIKNLAIQIHPETKYVIIQSDGHHPFMNDIQKINPKLYINNKPLKFDKQLGNDYYFVYENIAEELIEIKIHSSTFIPKTLGINSDTRELGLDIKSIKIE